MSVIKRFVAGAVCPRCAEMDTLKMYRDAEREHRECIKCGFEDSLRLDGTPEPAELETRVNRVAKPQPSGTQPLKFHPNPGLKRRED